MRIIGWGSYCSVFRLALCRGKKYGPNSILGTAKRLTRHFVIFSSSQRGRFICQNSRACSLPHLFITVSHVFSPTPLPLAPLRRTHSSTTVVYFIFKMLCSAAGSTVRAASNTFETYASELVSLIMKELVNLLCRENINIYSPPPVTDPVWPRGWVEV